MEKKLYSLVEKYLGEQENQDDSDTDGKMFDAFVDFLGTIDPDALSDDQLELYDNIMSMVDEDEEDGAEDDTEEEDDSVSEVKTVRVNRAARRKRQLMYKKNRMKMKAYQRKYKKTAAFRKSQRSRKRRLKTGRVTHYV